LEFAAEEAASMGHTKANALKRKLKRPKTILRFLDLEHSKSGVIDSLGAISSQDSYGHAIDEFITWYCSEPRIFRRINKNGKVWGDGITPKAIWQIVKTAAKSTDLKVAPHDLRRTCARLCHVAGGELEQIQFLLGHVSVQTTAHYLGCKQKLQHAVNDNTGLEIT
jgi:hypothetical protein